MWVPGEEKSNEPFWLCGPSSYPGLAHTRWPHLEVKRHKLTITNWNITSTCWAPTIGSIRQGGKEEHKVILSVDTQGIMLPLLTFSWSSQVSKNWDHYSHFRDENAETPNDWITYSKSQSQYVIIWNSLVLLLKYPPGCKVSHKST